MPVVVVVAFGEPLVSQQDGDGRGVDDRYPSFGLLEGWHDDDRRFVRRTSGFLVGWTWEIVVTVVCDGVPGSCPYESDDDGEDPELLPGWITRVEVVYEVTSLIFDVEFGDSFSVC